RDITGSFELTLASAGAPELHHEVSRRAELLNPIVAPVSNVHIVIGVYLYAPGKVELASAAAKATPLGQEPAVLGELLDAMIRPVHYKQVVLPVEGNPRRPVELAIAGAAAPPLAQFAPRGSPDGDGMGPSTLGEDFVFVAKARARGQKILPIAKTASGELAHVLFIDRADGNAFQLEPV